MTYFEILLSFIVPPLVVLLIIVPHDLWHFLFRKGVKFEWGPYLIILAHVFMALLYTTPWDNYLVATGVWWYDPELVIGINIGWVPIEEYTFFILQTMLTGLFFLLLARRVFKQPGEVKFSSGMRRWSSLAVFVLWIISTGLLFSGWKPGTYLTLILSWALVPIFIQVAFGADILFANPRLLAVAIGIPTLYLWLVDTLALRWGTWMIDPAQTTGIVLGVIPLEEMVFFLMTNVVIVFGITLMLSGTSWERAKVFLNKYPLRRFISNSSLILWLLALIAVPISMWTLGEEVFPIVATIGVFTHLAVTLVVLKNIWPTRRVVLVSALILIFACMVEAVGSRTGFPFGDYSYTEILQPQLLGVPALIPIAWLMMLPPAWGIAEAILSKQRHRLGNYYWLCYAALSGAAFTAWDLYLDPQMVSRGLWVWNEPGSYFGIPWQNYLGWWVSATIITLLIRPTLQPEFSLVVIYTITWIFQAIGQGIFWGQYGPALMGGMGMGIFVCWAGCKKAKEWRSYSGRWLATYAVQSRSQ